jgi:hypothetical protein
MPREPDRKLEFYLPQPACDFGELPQAENEEPERGVGVGTVLGPPCNLQLPLQ